MRHRGIVDLLTASVLRWAGKARRRPSVLVVASGAAAVALAVLSVRRRGAGWLTGAGEVVLAAAALLVAGDVRVRPRGRVRPPRLGDAD